MPESATVRELVEAAVAESIDEHLRTLHDDIVRRVTNIIESSLDDRNACSCAAPLNSAIVSVQSASQQVEILRHFLDGAGAFSARSALFILRGNKAVGWQARGFEDNDAVKAVTVDASTGILGNVTHSYAITSARVAEFDPKFGSVMGSPLDGTCVLVPLVVRGKVAAVLYVDSGDDTSPVEEHALEVVARAAGDWIELQALRKATGAPAQYPHPAQQSPANPRNPAPKVERNAKASAVSETHGVAQHAVDAPVVGTQQRSQGAGELMTADHVVVPPLPTLTHEPAVEVSPRPNSATIGSNRSSADEELHKKARRFAKLLVDEIILYNQPAVIAGRQNQDLYDRLKEPIEKSRATFEKRYAQTSAANCDYFKQALIAGLADHNPIALGSTFPR